MKRINLIDHLTQEHTSFRAKLAVLETALTFGPEAWFLLREISRALAGELREHHQHEARAIERYRAALGPHAVSEGIVEHRDEPIYLEAMVRFFKQEPQCSLAGVRLAFLNLTNTFRHHMNEQEGRFFPLVQQLISPEDELMWPDAHESLDVAVPSGNRSGEVASHRNFAARNF